MHRFLLTVYFDFVRIVSINSISAKINKVLCYEEGFAIIIT